MRQRCDNSAGNARPATCCGLGKPVLDGIRLSTGDAERVRSCRRKSNKAKDLASQALATRNPRPGQTEKRRSVAKSSSPVSGIAERYAGSLYELAVQSNTVGAGRGRSWPLRGAAFRKRRSRPHDQKPGLLGRGAVQGDRRHRRQGRDHRPRRQFPARRRAEPPPVRRARHDQGVPRASPPRRAARSPPTSPPRIRSRPRSRTNSRPR